MSPFQCERCWFVNICGRLPVDSSTKDAQSLALIRRVNRDGVWARATGTVSGMVRLAKNSAQCSTESGQRVSLLPIEPWPVADLLGMGIAVQMLEQFNSSIWFASLEPLSRTSTPLQQLHTLLNIH